MVQKTTECLYRGPDRQFGSHPPSIVLRNAYVPPQKQGKCVTFPRRIRFHTPAPAEKERRTKIRTQLFPSTFPNRRAGPLHLSVSTLFFATRDATILTRHSLVESDPEMLFLALHQPNSDHKGELRSLEYDLGRGVVHFFRQSGLSFRHFARKEHSRRPIW